MHFSAIHCCALACPDSGNEGSSVSPHYYIQHMVSYWISVHVHKKYISSSRCHCHKDILLKVCMVPTVSHKLLHLHPYRVCKLKATWLSVLKNCLGADSHRDFCTSKCTQNLWCPCACISVFLPKLVKARTEIPMRKEAFRGKKQGWCAECPMNESMQAKARKVTICSLTFFWLSDVKYFYHIISYATCIQHVHCQQWTIK